MRTRCAGLLLWLSGLASMSAAPAWNPGDWWLIKKVERRGAQWSQPSFAYYQVVARAGEHLVVEVWPRPRDTDVPEVHSTYYIRAADLAVSRELKSFYGEGRLQAPARLDFHPAGGMLHAGQGLWLPSFPPGDRDAALDAQNQLVSQEAREVALAEVATRMWGGDIDGPQPVAAPAEEGVLATLRLGTESRRWSGRETWSAQVWVEGLPWALYEERGAGARIISRAWLVDRGTASFTPYDPIQEPGPAMKASVIPHLATAVTESATAATRPWAGAYWSKCDSSVPRCAAIQHTYDLKGDWTPLKKYDETFKPTIKSLDWELDWHHSFAPELWWENHTLGRTAAAILMPRPSEDRPPFNKGELEALLTEKWSDPTMDYIWPLSPEPEDNAPMKPGDLWKALRDNIKDLNRPMGLEIFSDEQLAPGEDQIWHVPVFHYSVTANPATDGTATFWGSIIIRFAAHSPNPAIASTDFKEHTYEFKNLEMAGGRAKPGTGDWEHSSFLENNTKHPIYPDFAWHPLAKGPRINAGLDPTIIDQMIDSKCKCGFEGGLTTWAQAPKAVWFVGETRKIQWFHSGVPATAQMKVELVNAAGPRVLTNGVPVGATGFGSFTWVVLPNTPMGRFRLSVIGHPLCTVTSQEVEFRTPEIKLTAPAAGAGLWIGGYVSIGWTYQGDPDWKARITITDSVGVVCVDETRTISISDFPTPTGPAPVQIKPLDWKGGGGWIARIPWGCAAGAATVRVELLGGDPPLIGNPDAAVGVILQRPSLTWPAGIGPWTTGQNAAITWVYQGPPEALARIELLRNGQHVAWVVQEAARMPANNPAGIIFRVPQNLPGDGIYVLRFATWNASLVPPLQADSGPIVINRPPGGGGGVGAVIQVRTPNGGEQWACGERRRIVWAFNGLAGRSVGVELLRGAVAQSLNGNLPIEALGFDWEIPCDFATGPDYRIRVSTLGTPVFSDTGDAVFSLVNPTGIRVLQPNGGEFRLRPGAPPELPIRWAWFGNAGAQVRIELLRGAAVAATVRSSEPMGAGGQGQIAWTPPASIPDGANYRIRITSLAAPANADTSDAEFAIGPGNSVMVQYPNGGETWARGARQRIRWMHSVPGTQLRLDLMSDAAVIRNIAPSIPASAGYYDWPVPADLSGYEYKVRITSLSNPAIADSSDARFTIWQAPFVQLSTPNGGEILTPGSIQRVQWTYGGNPGTTLRADLLKNGQALGTALVASVPLTSGFFDWIVPAGFTPGADYTLKLTSPTGVNDASDAPLAILPATGLAVERPNGGEVFFPALLPQTIRWVYAGNPGTTVTVQLTKAGALLRTLAAGVPIGAAGRGEFTWIVPADLVQGEDYRIRLISDTGATDQGDQCFWIVPWAVP